MQGSGCETPVNRETSFSGNPREYRLMSASMSNASRLAPAAVVFLMTSGCLATQQQQADLSAKNVQLEKDVTQTRADLVALGRPHLVDPFFTLKAAAWYGATAIHCPPPYQPGKEQAFRNAVRDRADLDDLKVRGKPKTRAELKGAARRLAAE